MQSNFIRACALFASAGQSAVYSDINTLFFIVSNTVTLSFHFWKEYKSCGRIWFCTPLRLYNFLCTSLVYTPIGYNWDGIVHISVSQVLMMAWNNTPLSTSASWTVLFSQESPVVAGIQLKQHGSGCRQSGPRLCTSHLLSDKWSDGVWMAAPSILAHQRSGSHPWGTSPGAHRKFHPPRQH